MSVPSFPAVSLITNFRIPNGPLVLGICLACARHMRPNPRLHLAHAKHMPGISEHIPGVCLACAWQHVPSGISLACAHDMPGICRICLAFATYMRGICVAICKACAWPLIGGKGEKLQYILFLFSTSQRNIIKTCTSKSILNAMCHHESPDSPKSTTVVESEC